MKRVLVTGGAGFIGSNFIHYLLRTDPQVQIVNLDALTYAGSLENLKGLPDESRHTFVKGDITDRALLDELFAQHKIDTVVHFAAESHVDRSILDPGVFVNTNVIGTFTLLEAARKAWLVDKLVPVEQVRFHHVSTDEVFGTLSKTAPAFEEETRYAPRSPMPPPRPPATILCALTAPPTACPSPSATAPTITAPANSPRNSSRSSSSTPPPANRSLFMAMACKFGTGCTWTTTAKASGRWPLKGRVGETYCIGGDNQPPNIEIVKTICAILDELQPGSPFTPHEQLITYVQDRPGARPPLRHQHQQNSCRAWLAAALVTAKRFVGYSKMVFGQPRVG